MELAKDKRDSRLGEWGLANYEVIGSGGILSLIGQGGGIFLMHYLDLIAADCDRDVFVIRQVIFLAENGGDCDQ